MNADILAKKEVQDNLNNDLTPKLKDEESMHQLQRRFIFQGGQIGPVHYSRLHIEDLVAHLSHFTIGTAAVDWKEC